MLLRGGNKMTSHCLRASFNPIIFKQKKNNTTIYNRRRLYDCVEIVYIYVLIYLVCLYSGGNSIILQTRNEKKKNKFSQSLTHQPKPVSREK